jgi:hypothetical protein
MNRRSRFVTGLVAVTFVVSGCYGPFNLTRRLYQWNGQIAGKWEKEFVFILLAWAPVYGLAIAGDAVIFNSMEFWTGRNPVDPPGKGQSALPQTKRLARSDEEALLTYTPAVDGATLLIQQFRAGRPAGSLRLEHRDGGTVGSDADGTVLFTADTLPDGTVRVRDREGKVVASYAADEAERLLAAGRRW